MSQGLEKSPDYLGHMIMTEDGAVTNSGGEMSNDEQLAEKLTRLVHTAYRAHLSNPNIANSSNFKRLSCVWDDFVYLITISNHKIYVVKRSNVPTSTDAVVA